MVAALIERWIVGEGKLISEASLVELGDTERQLYGRWGKRIVELTDVYSHPQVRGQGWARVAVQAAIDHADVNAWDIFLRALAYSTQASSVPLTVDQLIQFYGRMGFAQTKRDPRVMLRRHRARRK